MNQRTPPLSDRLRPFGAIVAAVTIAAVGITSGLIRVPPVEATSSWTPVVFTPVGAAGGAATTTYGLVAAGFTNSNIFTHATIYDTSIGAGTDLNPPGKYNSLATTINGGRVGGVVDGHATIWPAVFRATSTVDMHPAGGWASSTILSMSATNEVGSATNAAGTTHAFSWLANAASAVDLGASISGSSVAYASTGTITVGHSDIEGAILWPTNTSSPRTVLDPDLTAVVRGISWDGATQVGSAQRGGGSDLGAMWKGTAASRVDLNPYGFFTSSANDAEGAIQVGDGAAKEAFITVSSSRYYSCAITPEGAAKCWGGNEYGNLGDGSTQSSTWPKQVVGLDSGVTAITATNNHACAVVRGAAKCWGNNASGQLGNGQYSQSSLPVEVVGLSSGVTAISSNADGSCAIASGAVKCWGSNSNGELGSGSAGGSPVPVQVAGLTAGATAISYGGNVCAIVSGSAKCWGRNDLGSLGNNSSITSSSVPVQVFGLTVGVTAIATGLAHSCAIVTGEVRCWGSNEVGQLGNSTVRVGIQGFSNIPVTVDGLAGGATTVSSNASQSTCVTVPSGTALCWGLLSWLQSERVQSVPQVITGLLSPIGFPRTGPGTTAISPFFSKMCAIYNGYLKCAGDRGELGIGGFGQHADYPVYIGVSHALRWSGSAASVVDMHNDLAALSCNGRPIVESHATDIDRGNITGWVKSDTGTSCWVLWKFAQ